MKRAITTLAVAVSALACPGIAQAAVTATPLDFGQVIVGQYPNGNVTVSTDDGQYVGDVSYTISNYALFAPTPGSTGTCPNSSSTTQTSCVISVELADSREARDISATMTITATEFDPSSGFGTGPFTIQVPLSASLYEPKLRVTRSGAFTRTAFYPRVVDGYRDTTTYRVAWNEPASGVVQVKSLRTGRIVKTFSIANAQSWAVTWNGRNRGGSKVKIGYYSFHAIAHPAHRAVSMTGVAAGPVRTRVRTGWKATLHRVRRAGTQTSSRSASQCYFESYQGELTLDSWGGSCTAHYSINVPSGAYKVGWGMKASRDPYLDISGPVSHYGARTSRGVNFTAYAGSWAALDVYTVHVTYWTKRRI